MTKNVLKPIKRVLIANRGEIARRIIRTCHAMGIETVAVYSDVDAHAPHVSEATVAEAIGAPNSYLDINVILDAVKRGCADSVHPGYGFLSENPDFVQALETAGIRCIGPRSETIRALGSKTNAKEIAARAEVPVAPTLLLSSDAAIDERARQLEEFASSCGYPVIIKAAAGGGGRGMRLVVKPGACKEALESAAREAHKSFGSAEVFVEKFIAPARHIEVQIAGDIHGRCIALGTRDCSLQRNNQKIIEEAPATGLLPGVSDKLCEAACRLAQASGYTNLGTVEFLYTADGKFYFLEVNTRLQVEHPVTEMVTGLDLVEVQLRIARGEDLQSICGDIQAMQPQGHSVEARWCAEEFTGRFVSATGVVLSQSIATSSQLPGTIRADMGYEVCSEVTHYYDSLLGKIIVHAPDRAQAIRLLADVLARSSISGVGTNRALLRHLLAAEEFCLQRHAVQTTPQLFPSEEQVCNDRIRAHAIIAALRFFESTSDWLTGSPWRSQAFGTGVVGHYPYSSVVQNEEIASVSSVVRGAPYPTVTVSITRPLEGKQVCVSIHEMNRGNPLGLRSYQIALDDAAPVTVEVLANADTTWVHTADFSLGVQTRVPRRISGSSKSDAAETVISSPIPGKVAALHAVQGAAVQEGELLLVLDSMKMEHPFRASRSGTLVSVDVRQGELIQAGAVLVVIA